MWLVPLVDTVVGLPLCAVLDLFRRSDEVELLVDSNASRMVICLVSVAAKTDYFFDERFFLAVSVQQREESKFASSLELLFQR